MSPSDPPVTRERGETIQQKSACQDRPCVVALVGNPNTGKTSLFNALTGYCRHVANYAGVTVDVAGGRVRGTRHAMELLDLPGAYSLAATSPDEIVLCNALCGRLEQARPPGVILAIVDAANPRRNLYLVSQLLEIGLPVVVALNMIDIAKSHGIDIDAERLSERLGVPVVPVVATRPATLGPLLSALDQAQTASPPAQCASLPPALWEEANRLREESGNGLKPSEALRVIVDRDGRAETQYRQAGGPIHLVEQARARLAAAGIESDTAEVRARYRWIEQILDGVITRRPPAGRSWSDRLDALLTDRIAGAAVLLVVLYGLFYTIYAGSGPLMDAVEGLFGWTGELVAPLLPAGAVRSAVVDGLIGGVGGVLVFLPQILLLFLFIAVLEEVGYLARAAFMVDRLMQPLGLSGRSFIPLLSGFACAIPAIMGARAIPDRRERFITILLVPFMSCSARLPVYVLLIGALIPARAWLGGWLRLDALVLLAMYLVGLVVAVPIALLLRRTVFTGPRTGFLLELPTYKWPRPRAIWQRVYLAGRGFVVRAGTIILVVNLVVWALGYFPRSNATRDAIAAQSQAEAWDDDTHDARLAGAYLRDSYLGRLGQTIEPAIQPLGWDWRIGVGVLASFPAREVIVATLGTVCNLEQDASAGPRSLEEALLAMRWEGTGAPLFTVPVGLSLLVFFALCAQCSATLVVMKKETGSWLWPSLSFAGMTGLAYICAWGTFAGARALGL